MEFYIAREGMLDMSRQMYSSIKDNPNIPQDVKDAWLEMCVSNADVMELTNV